MGGGQRSVRHRFAGTHKTGCGVVRLFGVALEACLLLRGDAAASGRQELAEKIKKRKVGADGFFCCREVYLKGWSGLDTPEAVSWRRKFLWMPAGFGS